MLWVLIVLAGIAASILLGALSNYVYDIVRPQIAARKSRAKRIVIGVIVVLPLLFLVALPEILPPEYLDGSVGELIHWYQNRARPNEMLVLLADFTDESEGATYDAAGAIAGSLKSALAEYHLPDVRLTRVPRTFKRTDSEAVRDMARWYGAQIAIWGHYDDGGMYARFSVSTAENVAISAETSLDRFTNLASPSDDFVFYVNQSLPSQLTYLTDFVVSEVYYLKASYVKSLGPMNHAIELAEQTGMKKEGDTLALLHGQRGFIHLVSGEYDDALTDMNEAIDDLGLVRDTVFNNRCAANSELRHFEQAIKDCSEAIEVRKDYASPYYNRARIYGVLGRTEELIEDSLSAFKYDVRCPGGIDFFNFFNAYFSLADPPEIASAVEEIIHAKPECDLSLLRYGLAEIYLLNGSYDQAVIHLDRLLDPDNGMALTPAASPAPLAAISPISPLTITLEISVDTRSGVTPVATRQIAVPYRVYEATEGDGIQSCIEAGREVQTLAGAQLAPPVSEIYCLRGISFAAQEQYKPARRDLEMAVRLDPQSECGNANLAYLYEMLGDERAAAALRASLPPATPTVDSSMCTIP